MQAVADELRVRVVGGHGAAYEARDAVVQAAHAVVRVDEDRDTRVHGVTTLLARGVGVAKCGDDAHLRGAAHICVGTLALWREGALPDEPVGGLLPLPQLVETGVAKVGGVLRTLVLFREERAFQKDSLDASLGRAVRALLHGLRDAGARLVDSVSRCGQGSCKDRRGSLVRKSIKNLTIATWVAVHEVMVCVTVYVSVDETRCHGGVTTVDHLEIW